MTIWASLFLKNVFLLKKVYMLLKNNLFWAKAHPDVNQFLNFVGNKETKIRENWVILLPLNTFIVVTYPQRKNRYCVSKQLFWYIKQDRNLSIISQKILNNSIWFTFTKFLSVSRYSYSCSNPFTLGNFHSHTHISNGHDT